MTATLRGPRVWECTRDLDSHREYTLTSFVETDDPLDGPSTVLQTPGLPQYGDAYAIGNDYDAWAFCTWSMKIRQLVKGEPNTTWEVEQTFSTKYPDLKSCKESQIEDPLLEPMKVSGSFAKFTEEAAFDLFGKRITNSAFEQIRGPQVEFDANRPSVKIEQNVASLDLDLVSSLVDTVNGDVLWGLPARTIKLSNVSWERKYHGLCHVYYTRTLEFEINYKTWDKVLADEGTKALNGKWDEATGAWVLVPLDSAGLITPDPNNPGHFSKYIDRQGNHIRGLLDGAGKPYAPDAVANVFTCSSCPGGAPKYIQTDGFAFHDAWVEGSPGDALLTYQSGCTWTGTDPAGHTITLTVDGVNNDWMLTNSILQGFWTGTLQCLPGVVGVKLKYSGANTWNVYIRQGFTSSPGTITVQKYNNANFLELGIPTEL